MVPNCVKEDGTLDEKIKDMDMGDVITDFYRSDAPQFKGKSKKKRREMAIAAKLDAGGKGVSEDLRKWFGKGGAGGTTKGGWDRYGSDGQKLGKCGGGKEGGAYAACLSAEKARKLGPKGRASFVRRKRADQKKSGDAKKGGNRTKGKKPTFSKTGT